MARDDQELLKVLVLFSNPPGQPVLRLDREDKVIARLARDAQGAVAVERLHASEVDDAHELIASGGYDVIQFSGHGSVDGLYLDKASLRSGRGELVSPQRFLSLIECADKTPLLVILLCCYSESVYRTLGKAAPFVITARCEVQDDAAILFIEGLYERLFKGHSVQGSFDHAIKLLGAKGMPADNFCLSRRSLLKEGESYFVESQPVPDRDTILVNLDAVAEQLKSFGMPEEELLHLLARKLRIHDWIFDGARDNAIIPIGRCLFGEFSWANARDEVRCTRLLKLRPDTPQWHWELWSRVLVSYNDLAALEYRQRAVRKQWDDQSLKPQVETAVLRFRLTADRYILPTRDALTRHDRFGDLLPHIELAIAEIEKAESHLAHSEYRKAVRSLELALTNYHEVTDGLRPPEETPSGLA